MMNRIYGECCVRSKAWAGILSPYDGRCFPIFLFFVLYCPHLFVTLTLGQDRLHLGNENKSGFILHFTRFALSFTLGEDTLARQ